MVGAGMMDEVSMMNLQEMINGMMPKKSKKRKVSVAEARKILLEEEAAKLKPRRCTAGFASYC
jgi:ATP-dependent HslUV protease ATP-binding subunit HslU